MTKLTPRGHDFYRNQISVHRPGAGNDSSQGFEIGSSWFQISATAIYGAWICLNAAVGAAQWMPDLSQQAIATLFSADMNSTADQPFVFPFGNTRKFGLGGNAVVIASNPSVSLTTAVGGIYPAISKGGTALVAATQVYSGLTAVGTKVNLTTGTTSNGTVFNAPLYLSLTTPQGTAALCDLYIFGRFLRA